MWNKRLVLAAAALALRAAPAPGETLFIASDSTAQDLAPFDAAHPMLPGAFSLAVSGNLPAAAK